VSAKGDSPGTCTQASSWPEAASYFSSSWLNLAPLESVNKISDPSVLADCLRLASVTETSTGKLARAPAPETLLWSKVIFLRYCQEGLYHPEFGGAGVGLGVGEGVGEGVGVGVGEGEGLGVGVGDGGGRGPVVKVKSGVWAVWLLESKDLALKWYKVAGVRPLRITLWDVVKGLLSTIGDCNP
jgi:hypothetical protein